MKPLRTVLSARALLVLWALPLHLNAALPGPSTGSTGDIQAASAAIRNEETPRSVIQRFMEFAKAGNFEMAGTYLDHRLPKRHAAGLAQKLYTLIDQQGWVALQRISDSAEGDITDSKDVNVEIIGSIRLQGTIEPILLHRIPCDSGEGMCWKFDHDFLQKIPALFVAIEEHSLKQYFPAWCHDAEFIGIKLWQWFFLLMALGVAIVLGLVINKIINGFLVRLNRRNQQRFDDTILRDSVRPLRYLLMIGFFHGISAFLEVPLTARNFIYSLETLLCSVIIASAALKSTNLFINYLQGYLTKNQRSNALAMLPPTRKALKLVIIGIAITYFLTQIGVNITAIVAGLGIGGIAVALAGQKTLENLIGGISIIIDQPVRVGDYCRFGSDKEGRVEDIGLRSTRIRTLDRTVVSIPNGEFAQIQLENFGKRDMIRLYQVLGIHYETSLEKLRTLLPGIREMLLAHKMVEAEPLRVRFINFGVNALEVEVFCYIATADQAVYLEVKEELNLQIMAIMAKIGIKFACPANIFHLEKTP